MMKRIYGATVLIALMASSTAPLQAEQVGPGDGIGDQIVVVNGSVQSVRVYVEDAEGLRHPLGSVERGETTTFEAPADMAEQGDFKVVVRPGHYSQFNRDQASIKTQVLRPADGETVILWLDRELSRSTVEMRAG